MSAVPSTNVSAASLVDPRAARQFTRAFLAIFTTAMAGTAAVAILVDPLHTFGTGRIRSVLSGERDEKPESYLSRTPPPSAVVLGSSHVLKLAPTCITELTGLPAYNFAFSNASIEDLSAVVGFIRARGRAALREVIIGVDVESFDDEVEVDQR